MDRLSELPDDLIQQILSYLPVEDVVPTTLLSKRWNNLWTTVPCLRFTSFVRNGKEIAQNFVNQSLMSWKGTKILKFEIVIWMHSNTSLPKSLASDMDLRVFFAVENKVEELTIVFIHEVSVEEHYCAPQWLYSCSSLRKLTLLDCNLGVHGLPSWNQLESLNLRGYCISECSINSILSGSPRLEYFDFEFSGADENLSICSTSLKGLRIKSNLRSCSDRTLRICCANLETLEIYGALRSKYLFVDVSSLTHATFDFYDHGNGQFGMCKLFEEMARQVISTFLHVESVQLSDWRFQAFGALRRKYLNSPFPNVKILELEAHGSCKLGEMVDVLRIFPNLITLVIRERYSCRDQVAEKLKAENFFKFTTVLFKVFLQLKTFDIASETPDSSIFNCIQQLKHTSELENSVFRFVVYIREDKLEVARYGPKAKGDFLQKKMVMYEMELHFNINFASF